MSTEALQPKDPVELASIRAKDTGMTCDDFESTTNEEWMLTELVYAANELGFIGRNYFFNAVRGFIFPKQFDQNKPVNYHSINNLTAEGPFATYSKVSIGKIIGTGTVRAVCLTFDKAIMLPYFKSLDDDDMLFVPVLSISSMTAIE